VKVHTFYKPDPQASYHRRVWPNWFPAVTRPAASGLCVLISSFGTGSAATSASVFPGQCRAIIISEVRLDHRFQFLATVWLSYAWRRVFPAAMARGIYSPLLRKFCLLRSEFFEQEFRHVGFGFFFLTFFHRFFLFLL
jgi:hypothetical protein